LPADRRLAAKLRVTKTEADPPPAARVPLRMDTFSQDGGVPSDQLKAEFPVLVKENVCVERVPAGSRQYGLLLPQDKVRFASLWISETS
jgi:hypothetical protein